LAPGAISSNSILVGICALKSLQAVLAVGGGIVDQIYTNIRNVSWGRRFAEVSGQNTVEGNQ